MSWYEWLIVLVPLFFVLGVGIHSRKYVKGVADFLVAGRMCGRYVICIGDVANALSIIGIVSYIEAHYKTGFAMSFWSNLIAPLSIVLSLMGYCTYRFRETRAMSLGQFLEMRYSRSLRIFASGLRSLAEMLANMIMPAIAARFFIYYLNLPYHINVFGWFQIPTFTLIVFIVLTMAISLICLGGTLSLVITDAIQGMFCYPLLVLFVIFILYKFSWGQEIAPVMMDRAAGESFINPYDVENLRDFNLFMVSLTILTTVIHRASWIGAGTSSAARTPHEQKMAGLLGSWRFAIGNMMYVLIAISIITVLNYKDFANDARKIRTEITGRVTDDILKNDPETRDRIKREMAAIPERIHTIGVDPPVGEKNNGDLTYLNKAHETLLETSIAKETAKLREDPDTKDNLSEEEITKQGDRNGRAQGNSTFQQFRTLYYQIMMAVSMRNMLPPVMIGLFCLMMVLAMLSTDDTRIFSAALTITQDVVMPLRKTPMTPKQHIKAIRIVAIGVGVFFICGSSFMSQLDYIQLFVTIACSIWMGGCGPMMIFGLYSRFGTTAGAWTSLLSGMFLSIFSMLTQRNWADHIYPFLEKIGMVDFVGKCLSTVSKPFNPYVVWEMNPVKCPINSYEFYFMTMVVTLILYCVVSKLTCRTPFNLERMLHRGKYAIPGEGNAKTGFDWSLKKLYKTLIGITPEYTTGDKCIAWGIFFHSFVYGFLAMFVGVVIWNAITPWKLEWWSTYFYIIYLAVPGVIACFATFWFGIGGCMDLFRLFRDLKARTTVNDLDDGSVEGNISRVDKAIMDAIEQKKDKPESQHHDDDQTPQP